MKAETTKWRVEERDGESTRALVLDAPSWEAALQAAWSTWELAHELRRAGVEVEVGATQIFIRGTPQSYRVAPEATPPKRAVPRPVPSMLPPMPIIDVGAGSSVEVGVAPLGSAPAAAPMGPAKADPAKRAARNVDANPNGRSSFGKLPRASSPDLEHEARTSRASQPHADDAPADDELPRLSSPSRPPVPFAVASAVEQLSRTHAPGSPFPLPPRLPDAMSVPPTPVEMLARVVARAEPVPAVASPVPARVSSRRLQVLGSSAVQLYAREQDPKDGAPVVYRQRGYALPMGTEENEAEAFGRWMLQQLQLQLPGGETPRLFHLAIYDEMFTGDPPILALCKLEWKEWKGQTNVTFPRRGEDSVMAAPRARTPSMPPPELSAPVPPPGNPTTHVGKGQDRVAALFLPSVTLPSFAVQPPPQAPPAGPHANRRSEGDE